MGEAKYPMKGIRFPPKESEAIASWARAHSMTFSEAVRELCRKSLTVEWDELYAPRIGTMMQEDNDRVLRDFEYTLSHETDLVIVRVDDLKAMVKGLGEKVDALGEKVDEYW